MTSSRETCQRPSIVSSSALSVPVKVCEKPGECRVVGARALEQEPLPFEPLEVGRPAHDGVRHRRMRRLELPRADEDVEGLELRVERNWPVS